MLRYTKDRARPGLVALYDIRPGNGAGQFLQPWSPHGASVVWHDAPWLTVTLTIGVNLWKILGALQNRPGALGTQFPSEVKLQSPAGCLGAQFKAR